MVSRPSDGLKKHIRSIPDFPKKGIVFRDITTLLKDKKALKSAVDMLYRRYHTKKIVKVVSVESRGFILGSALAYCLGAGFVPVRKPNKLPAETIKEEYQLEYGTDTLEIHTDAIQKGERVLIVDDLLATGGTAEATCRLVKRLKGKIVALAFLIELAFLGGRKKLHGHEIFSLIRYDSE
ncbi:MAG: adenine phosphoribosyltransferase [Bacteroidota bacterium]|jgi:adenine phosphoribosyltransferase